MKKQAEDIFEPAIPVAPQGWDVLSFDQAVDVVSDKSKRVKQSAYLQSGKLPVIDQGQEFIGGYTDDEDMAFEGDLPVILFGDHTRSIKYVNKPFAVGAEGVKILKPSVGFDPKYLYYLLRSLQIPSRGYSRHFQFLRKFHFPLAPLDQQKRIVAEIEKQFSRLDEAVANLKRVKANLKRYKAAVLKAAVEGRLVETEAERARRASVEAASRRLDQRQDAAATATATYETGEQLLQRILETRRSQWKGKGKYKEPAAPDTTDMPELPEGWTWASVNQIAEKVVDGTHHTPEYVPEGVPFISVKDVRESTIHFDHTKYISPSAHEELIKRCHPEMHDVLITKSGTIGRTAIVTTERPFSLFVSVALIKPVKPVVNSRFLQIALDAYIQSIDIAQDVKGGLLKNLHLEDLRVVSMQMPPAQEQLRIVAEVDRHLSLLREIEVQVDANLQRAERLRQAVLSQAFSGGLA